MFAVENETILHASPPKVWTALTRFENLSRWNPFIRIDGPIEQGAFAQYSFRMKSGKAHFFTIDAHITKSEPQKNIVLRFGFGWLIAFEESYTVVPVPVGPRLLHDFRCTGVLSALKLKKIRRNFGQMLKIIDRLFQRHLSPARSPGPPSSGAMIFNTGPGCCCNSKPTPSYAPVES